MERIVTKKPPSFLEMENRALAWDPDGHTEKYRQELMMKRAGESRMDQGHKIINDIN